MKTDAEFGCKEWLRYKMRIPLNLIFIVVWLSLLPLNAGATSLARVDHDWTVQLGDRRVGFFAGRSIPRNEPFTMVYYGRGFITVPLPAYAVILPPVLLTVIVTCYFLYRRSHEK